MPGAVFVEGESVSLRTVEEDDLAFLRDGVNDPVVRRGVASRYPKSMEDQQAFFEEEVVGGDGVHLLVCRDDTRCGVIGVTPQEDAADRVGRLGLWLVPSVHGEGVGTEAARLFVSYLFDELNYHKVYARVHEDNEPSHRLWEKLDFVEEARLRDHVFVDGSYRDLLYYGVCRDEWG